VARPGQSLFRRGFAPVKVRYFCSTIAAAEAVHRPLYHGRLPGRIDDLKLYGGASAVKDKN